MKPRRGSKKLREGGSEGAGGCGIPVVGGDERTQGKRGGMKNGRGEEGRGGE
jgi:hypothetical protein